MLCSVARTSYWQQASAMMAVAAADTLMLVSLDAVMRRQNKAIPKKRVVFVHTKSACGVTCSEYEHKS